MEERRRFPSYPGEGAIRAMISSEITEHELHCSIGQKVDALRVSMNRIFGALAFLALLVPLVVWALSRTAAKQDQLQQAVQEIRILVERRHSADDRPSEGHVARAP